MAQLLRLPDDGDTCRKTGEDARVTSYQNSWLSEYTVDCAGILRSEGRNPRTLNGSQIDGRVRDKTTRRRVERSSGGHGSAVPVGGGGDPTYTPLQHTDDVAALLIY